MKALIYLISIFTFWCNLCAAAPTPREKASTPTTTAAPQPNLQLESELKVLKMQVATMKEYHSSLLDTVYWALGTVATVAALLVGFGWFANFKFHESEKQRLKEELEGRLERAQALVDTRLSSSEVEVIKSIDSRLDSHLSGIARDIDIARAEAARLHQENADAIKQQKAEVAALQQARTMNQKRDSELEASLRAVEEHIWQLKGIPENRLLTQFQCLQSALDGEHRYYITSTMERMQQTINESILPAKKTLPKSVLDSIKGAVARAANIEPLAAANVSQLLEQIQPD